MPIFGELRDLTLSEILPLVSARKGLLEITGQSESERWQFGIDGGRLMAVAAHGRLLEPMEARATVYALLSRRDGSFEFSEGHELAGGGLHWGISQLLGAFHVLPSLHDGAQPADLPHPESRFVRATGEPPLEEPLFTFWHRALPYLESGASVQELATHTDVALPAAQHYVARLRALGKLTPHHAYRQSTERKQHRGIARRLLRVLGL